MNLDTAIRLSAQVQGANNIRGLAQQFQGLSSASQLSGRQLDRLYTETKKLSAAAGGSINALRQQRQALSTLREAVDPTSRRFQMLTRDVETLDKRLKALNGTQQQVANGQRGMARQAAGSALGTLATGGGLQGAAGALAGGLAFSGSAAGLAAGAGLTAAAAGGALAARVGVEAETAQVRLKALTDQFGEYNQAQAAAARIAGTLRISTIEASDGFSKLYAALRPTGVTLQEVEDAYIGFTAAARVSGATAQESSAALEQLKQALGSGVLQGDELRSIREQVPLVGQAIAREMGVTIGELKKLGSEGQITTDIVLRALAKLKNENLGKLNQQFNTSAQAIADLRIATEDLGRTVARVFGPTTVALLKGFTAAVKDAADVWGSITGDRGAEGRIQDQIRAREQAQRDTNARPFAWWDNNGRRQFFEQRSQQLFQQYQQNRLSQVSGDNPTSAQTEARAAAEAERAAARARSGQEERDKARKKGEQEAQQALERQIKLQERLSDLRLQTEERIADLMQQTNDRALQMVQQINDEKLQGERRIKALQAETAGNYADVRLGMEILRQRQAGMPTDALELQLRMNQATRQDDANVIRIVDEARDRNLELTRRLDDFSKNFTTSLQGIFTQGAEQYRDAVQDAARSEERAARSAVNGIIARTGSTGDSTGPHLDARWADKRPITAAQVDRYLSLNGRSFSSYGVTSGYGPRNLFGRSFHYGVDAGTPAGTPISLKGGATFGRNLGNTGAGGYAIEIMTPEGPMRLLHLQAGSATRAATSPAPALLPSATGAIQIPGADALAKAVDALSATFTGQANAEGGKSASELFASRYDELRSINNEIDSQILSTSKQLDNYQKMLTLMRSGLSPELAQMRIDTADQLEKEKRLLQTKEQQLIVDMNNKILSEDTKKIYADLLALVRGRLDAQPAIAKSIGDEQAKLEKLKTAYEEKKALVEGIASTIGDGIGSSLDLLITGTDNWGNSLREIASGVLQDIARQLTQAMVIKPIVGGITGAFGFANGGIMTSAGPLPLNAYANGGIASGPQLALFGEGRRPEAYVPLPDGRRIPVAMQGGQGGATVNVSVDARGTNVSGDTGQSERLGRVVAQAVQQELIRQRRPGGILAAAT